MEGKHTILLAGGVAAVVGVGKLLTRDVHIPGWLTLLALVPVVALFGYAAMSMLAIDRRSEEKRRAKERKRLKEELDGAANDRE
ncbi:hypothetical protein [Pseudaminobacter soli (ex Li et al. 2025)]|uniref:hypothetical protein n=1 Tax=Pseudaminobacter soli (ex Li et al. 2025) TaxID=1295366 RepID=UPI0011B25673|nr:hypothetical protein [Mesorhizobium soli]